MNNTEIILTIIHRFSTDIFMLDLKKAEYFFHFVKSRDFLINAEIILFAKYLFSPVLYTSQNGPLQVLRRICYQLYTHGASF